MSETSALLPVAPINPKSILESKTFWTNVIPVLATLVGYKFPTVGQFLSDNALAIIALFGSANIGLRTQTKAPVTFSVSKSF